MATETRRPRSDARANRERILKAARTVLARDGADVPSRTIARAAGLGVATLYRYFPTKQALLAEAFAHRTASCRVIVEEGLVADDPWVGFGRVVENLMVVHALGRPAPPDPTAREQTLRLLIELMARAKANGRLRDDVTVDDLVLVLMANEGIRARSPELRTAAARRFAALVVRGVAAS